MADLSNNNSNVTEGNATDKRDSGSSNAKGSKKTSRRKGSSSSPSRRPSNGKSKTSGTKGTTNRSNSLFGSSQYILDVTRLPFTNTSGINVDISGDVYSASSKADLSTLRFTTPGVAGIVIHPGTTSVGFMSALNIAARNLYTIVTSNNSRNSTYDACDLMLYVLATSELFKTWRYAITVYGVATQYSALNRYLPDTILRALGVNPDSIRDNLCDFRAALNLLSNKINSIVIPADLKFTQFQFERFSAIYADSENSRAQLYVFKPSGYMLFDDAYSEQGAGLKYTDFISLMGWNDLINVLNKMATAIISGSVNNLISADILKAFGDRVAVIPEIPEDFTTPIVYDMEMLESINNMRVNGTGNLKTDIYQVIPSGTNTAPYLESLATFKPTTGNQWMFHSMATFINTNYEELSPDQVFYRTMYQMPVSTYSADSVTVELLDGFISAVNLYLDPTQPKANASFDISAVPQNTDVTLYGKLSQFDNHPLIAMVDTTVPDGCKFSTFFGDVKNMCFIKSSDAVQIMQAALMALFSV